MQDLRTPRDERARATGPVDVEGCQHLWVLVEGEEDERAKTHQQRGPEAAGVLEAGEVGGGLRRRHGGEAAPAPSEERRTELHEQEAERQPPAERPGEEGKEAGDPV